MIKKTFIVLSLSIVFSGIAQETSSNELKYRRSSLYTAMIETSGLPYANEIKEYFSTSPMPDKFNDHNLGKRIYADGEFSVSQGKFYSPNGFQQKNLDDIARDVVAKWFNRSEQGGFNMDLIGQRGNYDASAIDIVTAKASKRGLDMLADAGEELIGKTFILVNEFKYVSKEEVAEKAQGWLAVAGFIGDQAGISNASTITSLAGTGASIAGKGYVVKTTAHLYQLVWDEETAATFYNDYWADDQTITPEKKQAFDQSTIFKLKYVGSDNSWADVQSSIFTNKSEVELVQRATTKAMDAVIVKLQKTYDQFKTKTPIFTGEPITAKIGLKEGLTEKSTFEVIEQQIDENGRTKYVSVGTVKVDKKYAIWDNRYGANEENPNSTADRTYFKKASGGPFYSGMLLVQKGGKGFNASQKKKKSRENKTSNNLILGSINSDTGHTTTNSVSTYNHTATPSYSDSNEDYPNSWFIRAGINSTNFLVDDGDSGLDNRTGFFADFGYEVRGKNFGCAFSLMYSQEGSSDGGGLSYINMVVAPKLYIAKVLFVQAGSELGLKIGAEDEYIDELTDGLDVKILLGGGVQLGGNFFIDFRYRIGVIDINSLAMGSYATINNTGIQIGAGIKF